MRIDFVAIEYVCVSSLTRALEYLSVESRGGHSTHIAALWLVVRRGRRLEVVIFTGFSIRAIGKTRLEGILIFRGSVHVYFNRCNGVGQSFAFGAFLLFRTTDSKGVTDFRAQ